MKKTVFILAVIAYTGILTACISGSDEPAAPAVLTINATDIVKPVEVKFGSGIGSLHRGPGWPPVDLNDPDLIALLNELNPGFVNLQYTMSPQSIEHVIGLPFYPESAGDYSQRLSYAQTFAKMGIDANSTGPEGDLYALYTSAEALPEGPAVVNGIQYNTYEELLRLPPHKNYDDMLQFLESLDAPPEVFIRVPTFFFAVIDDPFPRSSDGRVVIMRDLDPQTGADLVHYLNDPPTTELGQLRAANGHPQPYNVTYFMLGNEVWWPYTEFDLSADRIVKQTVAFAQAMKTADPTIQIVFNPVNDAFPESFLRTDDPATAPIIQKLRTFNEEIIPRTREFVDAVEFFQYGLAIGDGTVLPELDEAGWQYVMAHSYVLDKYGNAGRHRAIADQYGPDTALIMGEFSGPPARLGGAIYDADYMIYLLNNDYDVFVANWNLGLIETNYYGLINQDVFQERPPVRRPSFYVQKMFNNYFGDVIVASEIAGSPTFDVKAFDAGELLTLPAEQDVPSLNAIATTEDGKLYLMIVNRDLERDIAINIELNGFIPAPEATAYVLNGPAIDATNEKNPENVTMREDRLEGIANSFFYTVEKHSVTLITLISAQK